MGIRVVGSKMYREESYSIGVLHKAINGDQVSLLQIANAMRNIGDMFHRAAAMSTNRAYSQKNDPKVIRDAKDALLELSEAMTELKSLGLW